MTVSSTSAASVLADQRLAVALSATEVGTLLGVSRSFVWKLHSQGKLPRPFRLGRAVRWSRREVEEWADAGAPSRDRWEALRREGAG